MASLHKPLEAKCCRDHIDMRARGGCRDRQLEQDITSLEESVQSPVPQQHVWSAQNGGLCAGPGGILCRGGARCAMG